MIIAHLARACYPFHPFGGLEQHVYQLTLELARLGHTVHLYTQPPDSGLPTPDFTWPVGVYHHFLPYQSIKLLRRNSIPDRLLNYPIFSWRLAHHLRQLSPRPQVVYAHGLAAFGYAAHSLDGVPLVLNPHGMEEFKNRSPIKQIAYAPFRIQMRYAARQSAAVIATDQALIPEVANFLEVPMAKIRLIPNAVDLESIDCSLGQAQNPAILNGNKPSLLMLSVGRLEENKGFETGLLALKLLADRLPEGWRWIIAGDGSLHNRLKAEAERLQLTENVIFAGKVATHELYSLYNCADLLLHPTLYEGSSLVTLEALASGLPVVASATGGLPDKIFESGPNENGRLAVPGDPVNLALKLNELLSLPLQHRCKLGQNGRRVVESYFNWRTAGFANLELYEALCSQSALVS